MSENGRAGRDDGPTLAEVLSPKWLRRHRYSAAEFIHLYGIVAARAAAKKLTGLRTVAPHLLEWISDEKTVYTALRHMDAHGSHAPGPDGLRYEDIALVDEWAWCRRIRDEIRKGGYTPEEERLLEIPKGPGRGSRQLVVQSVRDRVVHRAVVEVLQPLLDPLFDPWSFGYRPKKGPQRALATAEKLYRDEGLGVWVSADVKDAFPSVPVGRLLGVVRKYLPDGELLDFLKVVIRPDKAPGLRQGSPLSPLLLNLYLHHVLDRPWRRRRPDIPLLRFADDILLLCRTPEEARSAYEDLVVLLTPAGFELKEGSQEAVRHLATGQDVNWMGFAIGVAPNGLRFAVTEDAWGRLAVNLVAAHGRPHSPLAAVASLLAWVGDKAPCYPHVHLDRAYTRIKSRAEACGWEEIPERHEVAKQWQLAYARWCKLRDAMMSPTI